MTKGVGDMIDEIFKMLSAHGIDIPVVKKQEVKAEFFEIHAGENLGRVPSQPKLRHAVRLAKLTKYTQAQMALATGLSVRQIRRIQRGK